MRDMEWLVIGGVVLLTLSNKSVAWGKGWVMPVPDLVIGGKSFPALVTHEYESGHWGVDVMYRRGREYFAPAGTPIMSARPGKVWSVKHTPKGIAVVVDHGKPFATAYYHLESVSVAKGATVAAGAVIGTMGIDPQDAGRVRHLHFEVWHEGFGNAAAIDPEQAMKTWRRS